MREKKTVAAFMYDFDNTLSTKDMQEYAFIPSINMDAKDFWAESNMYAKKYNMDSILAGHNDIQKQNVKTHPCFNLGKQLQRTLKCQALD